MTAMVGVLLSLVTPVLGPMAGATSDICAAGDVCQLLGFARGGDDDGNAAAGYALDGSWTYATPAEIDCRAMRLTIGATAAGGTGAAGGGGAAAGKTDGELASGACNQPSLWDFRYRVSRFADGERPSGAFAPQRGRGLVRSVATFTRTWRGLPHERSGAAFVSLPPIALYARALQPGAPACTAALSFDEERGAPSRVIEPPERPPRA